MEQIHENGANLYRLNEQTELVAATYALRALRESGTPRYTDEDKEHAQQLQEIAATGEMLTLTAEDFKFLAGASRYFLTTAHFDTRNIRKQLDPEILEVSRQLSTHQG